MNYPDLETCEIIGLEFPNSEFVYYKQDKNSQIEITERSYAESLISEIKNEAKKEDRPNALLALIPIIVAPAPTCEELGEWMLSHNDGTWNVADTLVACWLEANETQARAEAVKLILEGK